MSNHAKLDLTQKIKLDLCINKGVIYAPFLKGFSQLDSDYTLEIDNKIYNVENGITLINTEEQKKIVFTIDGSLFEVGNYVGKITSVSRVSGLYLQATLNLKVIE